MPAQIQQKLHSYTAFALAGLISDFLWQASKQYDLRAPPTLRQTGSQSGDCCPTDSDSQEKKEGGKAWERKKKMV